MNKSEYLLSISSSPDGNEICLHANSEGLTVLIGRLEALRKALKTKEAPHAHLMSASRGVDDVTETLMESEVKARYQQVNHVKLHG